MPVDERDRHRLHQRLDELLGPDPAATLMSYLPPVGWADVATKQDLDALGHRFDATLYRELNALRGELHGEMGSLRSELHGEMGSLRSELQGEIGSLRSELQGEIGSLRSELHGEMASLRSDLHAQLQAMARTYLRGNVALAFTIAAIAFGAAQLV